MAQAPVAPSAELQDLYATLYHALEEEAFEEALSAADAVLKSAPDELEARAAKAAAALHTGDYALALTTALPAQDFERAYALYRLGRGSEALAVLDGSPEQNEISFRHLRGQVLFKEGRYDEAIEVFSALVEEGRKAGDEEDVELLTNLYAAFVAARRGQEALSRFPLEAELRETSYELAFNSGAALVDTGDLSAAEARLREALNVCERLGLEEEMSPVDILNEGSGIRQELAYVLASQGRRREGLEMVSTLTKKANKLSDPVVRASAMITAAALKGGRGQTKAQGGLNKLQAALEEAGPKMIPGQSILLRVNEALMLVHSGRLDDAEKAVAALKKEAASATAKGGGQAPGTWRVALVEVAIKMQRAATDPAGDLQTLFQTVQAMARGSPSQDSVDAEQQVGTAWAQCLVDQGKLREAAQVLESIPSLQGYPAVVATVASIYAKLGLEEEVLATFDRAVSSFPPSLPPPFLAKLLRGTAALRRAKGDQAGAATALRALLDSDKLKGELDSDVRLRTLADLVMAMSWVDGEEAGKIAEAELPAVEGEGGNEDEEVDASILEEAGLPRRQGGGERRTLPPGAAPGGQKEKEEEEHAKAAKKAEVRRRQRARARTVYLAKLTAEGKYDASRPGPPPDPERWIAKNQRSYNKRGKKGRGKFVGAQGSGNGAARDAAMLDVASRVEAKKKKGDEDGRGGVKMGGGRRRRK